MNHAVIAIFILTSLPNICTADEAPTEGTGQLGEPVTWIPVPESSDEFYMAQQSRDSRLILTPNESFFPKLGLAATGTGGVPDSDKLNGDKSFSAITKWDSGDTAEWAIFTKSAGTVTFRIWMSTQNTKGQFQLQIGNDVQNFSTIRSSREPLIAAQLNVRLPKAGMHTIKLTCVTPGDQTAFHWMHLAGRPIEEAAVLRKRWRPAAAHTKFTSSQQDGNIRLWVMEMDAIPGELGFYCPITTPFGYYGPTWQADGTVNKGFNFSLWSYKRGAPEPSIEKLSHLLAIGNRNAKFSGFGHEGTGVKIRDWEPLNGQQGQRQAIALRVEPGPIYDTYFSYFYDNRQKQWQLFGAGNKFNKDKPLSSLWVGSFVEVPGPPPVQRTGPYERTMRYRGWAMNDKQNWSQLDRMTLGNVNKQTGLTHTNRGVTDDGWFYLQTGGWKFRKGSSDRTVKLQTSADNSLPKFLGHSDIAALTSIPSTVQTTIVKRTSRKIEGTFDIKGVSKDASVTIFWGDSEGLTFSERWQNQKTIPSVTEGSNSFSIEQTVTKKTVFIRLLLQNQRGQFWSQQTLIVDP